MVVRISKPVATATRAEVIASFEQPEAEGREAMQGIIVVETARLWMAPKGQLILPPPAMGPEGNYMREVLADPKGVNTDATVRTLRECNERVGIRYRMTR